MKQEKILLHRGEQEGQQVSMWAGPLRGEGGRAPPRLHVVPFYPMPPGRGGVQVHPLASE